MRTLVFALALALPVPLALAGCSSILGIDDLGGPSRDGGPGDGSLVPGDGDPGDGDRDGSIVPENVTITGLLMRSNGDATYSPIPNHAISFVEMPGRVQVATGSSDANGRYTLVVPTGGAPVDGHLFIPGAPGTLDLPPSFDHLGGPLTADVERDVRLVSNSQIISAAQGAGDPRGTDTAFVRMLVLLEDGTRAAGALVSVDPAATIRYAEEDGRISMTATQTSTNGNAFVFNAAVGMTEISGQIDGDQFTPRTFEISAAGEAHYVILQQ